MEESILETVRRLPVAKQEDVLRFAENLHGQQDAIPPTGRSREMSWIERNRSQYVNQWVAVEGDRVVAAGEDPIQVYQKARLEGICSPFVVHLVADELPFVPGW